MIARITGTLERIDELVATVAVTGGVAYEVNFPAFLSDRLAAKVGGEVTFTTFHYLEGQGQGASFIPRLIGFSSVKERDFFELFTTVKGIGNRKALRAMAVEPAAIAAAIARKEPGALSKLPEIGKRLAETIIAELTGKVEMFLSSLEEAAIDVKSRDSGNALMDEAILTLVALGETRGDAERLVVRAIEKAKRESLAAGDAEELLQIVFALRA